jgi:hypothetical protein
VDLWQYYSLEPGKYRLQFKYDTRLLAKPTEPPWVPWSDEEVEFTVVAR